MKSSALPSASAFIALATSFLAFGLATSAGAQITLTAADSHTGAAGAAGIPFGSNGSDGYDAPGFVSSSYILNGPTLIGGVGGTAAGTDATVSYEGGSGGYGLTVGGGEPGCGH